MATTQTAAKDKVTTQAPAEAPDANLPATTAEAKLPGTFDQQLREFVPQFKAALPSHIPVERFKRMVITAINQNPDLLGADRRSLFNACVKAAHDGLYPDGREAALVIFNTKVKGADGKERYFKLVQYMPMIAGVRKRMRNSGAVNSAEAHVVYKHDDFDYALGDEPHIFHKPAMGNRGEAIGAYAIIKLANGEVLRDVMSTQDIEKTRSQSRAPDSLMWKQFWGEGARKTVLRRCAKAAPVEADLDAVLRRDDETPEISDTTQGREAPPEPRRNEFIEGSAPKPTLYHVVDEQGEIVDPLPSGEFAKRLIDLMSEAGADFHGVYDRHADVLENPALFKDVRAVYARLCAAEEEANKKRPSEETKGTTESAADTTAAGGTGAEHEPGTEPKDGGSAPRTATADRGEQTASHEPVALATLNVGASAEAKKRWLAQMTQAVKTANPRDVTNWWKDSQPAIAQCEKVCPAEVAVLKRAVDDRFAS